MINRDNWFLTHRTDHMQTLSVTFLTKFFCSMNANDRDHKAESSSPSE